MPVARVDEHLAQLGPDGRDQPAGGVEVALEPEERVLLHAVDLHRDAGRPRPDSPLAGDRQARLVEQRAARARPGLGQPLGDGDAAGEAGVHEALGQVGDDPADLPAERLVPDLLGEPEALVEGRRPLAVEQVRGVDGVPAGAQLIGEGAHPVGESLHVVDQQDLGHLYTPCHRTMMVE